MGIFNTVREILGYVVIIICVIVFLIESLRIDK